MSDKVLFLTRKRTESLTGGRRSKADLAVYDAAWQHACSSAEVIAAIAGKTPTYDATTGIWSIESTDATITIVSDAAKIDASAEFSTSSTYAVGDYVKYRATETDPYVNYICNKAVATPGAFVKTFWTEVTVNDGSQTSPDATEVVFHARKYVGLRATLFMLRSKKIFTASSASFITNRDFASVDPETVTIQQLAAILKGTV